MTDVLLMQVPVTNTSEVKKSPEKNAAASSRPRPTLTFGKYQDGKFGLGCDVGSQPAERGRDVNESHRRRTHEEHVGAS